MGQVLYGACCTGEGRGLSRLELDGGRTIQARLLVGADGANSR
jgi:2-polyprenyl-6-methoxyphenol hydroxylase-like FAD-dependent oxidoreductase